MRGDNIVVVEQQARLAEQIVALMLPKITSTVGRYAIAVAGESGSGKTTTAVAIAQVLEQHGRKSVLLHQDDYYVLPPLTNDRTRRQNPDWRGLQEVRLDVLDQHIQQALDGAAWLEKPLSIYAEDRFDAEILELTGVQIILAEGTFVSLLRHAHTHIFIDRDYRDTRAYREQRARHTAELDPFTESILLAEHEIVAAHKSLAEIVIAKTFKAEVVAPAHEDVVVSEMPHSTNFDTRTI